MPKISKKKEKLHIYEIKAWYRYGTKNQQEIQDNIYAKSLQEAKRKALKNMKLKHLKIEKWS
jgi:hypothetical protein